jgi:membrane protein
MTTQRTGSIPQRSHLAEASPDRERKTARQVVRNPKALWQLARDSFMKWLDDYAPSMGAAISYYTVFSIAPLLVIVIAIAGFVLGHEAASGQVFTQLQGLVGDEGASAAEGMVKSASEPGRSALGAIAGFATLLLGATTVFGELQSALDRIWKAPAAEKREGLWKLLRTRILSFGLILAIGFLLLVSLVISAGLAALGTWWAPVFGGWETVLHIVNFVVSFAVVTALFAIIYKWLPRAEIGWHDVWIGAAATALLFSIGKFLIGLYIGKSSIVSGFGAAGSLVVLLLWVYYSAQIFLLGAEFTWIYAYRYGSRRGEVMPGQKSGDAEPGQVGDDVARPSNLDEVGRPARAAAPRILHTARTRAPRAAAVHTHHKPVFGFAVALGTVAAIAAVWRARMH